MNKYYASLVRALDLPDAVAACVAGRAQPPIVGLKSPAEWYGFPPVLIPLWSDGSGPNYIGIWKHWFTDRPLSFVEMNVDAGRATVEIARTAEQLFCYIAMAAISINDGVEPELEKFCEVVGIQNLAEIDSVSLDTGDNPIGFAAITQFKNDLPLTCVHDSRDYSGTFPTVDFAQHNVWRDTCSFEFAKETLANWPNAIERPRWLAARNQKALFRQFLDSGNLHDAWLTLNSSGWSFVDAKAAITDLERSANDDQFSLLASSWLSVADEVAGSY